LPSASPGALRFHGRIDGRAAHSGIAPERGIDALRTASRAFAGMPLGRIDADTTANVGTLRAGSAINVVPDRATFEGEIRSTDVGAVERTLVEIRDHLERACGESGARLTLAHDWDFRPYRIEEDAPVRRRAVAAIEAVGLEVRPTTSAGGSDANSLNSAGLPAVNLGIGAQNPHGDDEFVLLADLASASAIALDLMTRP
jgi:tripeptide aminopeptidase